MAEDKSMRLSQVARVLNVGLTTVVSRLAAKGFKVDSNPNTKINNDQLGVLEKEFSTKQLLDGNRGGAETAVAEPPRRRDDDQIVPSLRDKFGRSIAADAPKPSAPTPDVKPAAQPVSTPSAPPVGPKILGKIDLTAKPGTISFNPATGRSEPVQPVAKAPAPVIPPSAPVVEKTVAPTVAPVVNTPVAVKSVAPVAVNPVAPVAVKPVAPVVNAEPTPKPVIPAPQPVAVSPAQKPAPAVQPVAPLPASVAVVAPVSVPRPVDVSKLEVQSVVPNQPATIAKSDNPSLPVRSAAEQPSRPAQQTRSGNALENRSERPRDTRPSEPNRGASAPKNSRPVAESKPAESAQPAAKIPEPPAQPAPEPETIRATGSHQLQGLNVIGKVDLSQFNRPPSNNSRGPGDKRQRIRGGRNGAVGGTNQPNQQGGASVRNDRGPNGPSDRPAGDRGPRPDRPIGDRPPGDRSTTDRPAGDRNQQGNRPPGDRGPRPDRPAGDRSATERPVGDRSQQGSGTNLRSDRPPGDRNQPGNRPPGTGDRGPRTDRPAGDRNTTDRPATDRPAGDRSPSDRPAGGNTGSPPAPGTGYQGGNNRSGGSGYQGGNNNRGGAGGGNNRGGSGNANRGGTGNNTRREAPTASDVKKSIQATNDRMRGNQPNRGADRRKDRRNQRVEDRRLMSEQEELEAKTLKVTEFISANDLATFMEVSVNEVIATCMSLGMFVSINQRLDAEAITVIADEFGFDVQFVSAEDETEAAIEDTTDTPESLQDRAPIVTIMGHVDHGKTSLLDYIRRAKVAAGEAGGITQHIGAYGVTTQDGRKVTFLDTPGHEAFTAMRARGAKVTDVVIIVIAADDSVMPQTREAINHAQVAGVPIVFAFSKVDKNGANTEKIREELANMNLLVEDWGGKYQAQEISSKSGLGIDDLLEKVLLEAELLELKANPNRRAMGTVIEAELDKGRGYVTTVLVENGTLKQGDIMLVGAHYGRIRAMTDDRGNRIKEAGPATPVQILGLPGAPQAGDKFNIMETDREAREIANKREQLLREQTLRTRRHITLEEIGRRKAIGTFKELNVIVKGDVDGSVEALSDSLLKLSTPEVQVNIIHKGVGQISEADVMLASASDAIVVGFQVRPSPNARRQADQEQIEIRMYSIIYDAINEIRDAMEGLLAPSFEETVTGNIEVRDVFKITKVGTVAGCYVTDGFVKRNNKIRIIRDFIVVHTGEIDALKRFKDDVAEVKFGYECGLSIKNFNDIQVGDVIESFEIKEVKRTL